MYSLRPSTRLRHLRFLRIRHNPRLHVASYLILTPVYFTVLAHLTVGVPDNLKAWENRLQTLLQSCIDIADGEPRVAIALFFTLLDQLPGVTRRHLVAPTDTDCVLGPDGM